MCGKVLVQRVHYLISTNANSSSVMGFKARWFQNCVCHNKYFELNCLRKITDGMTQVAIEEYFSSLID